MTLLVDPEAQHEVQSSNPAWGEGGMSTPTVSPALAGPHPVPKSE